MSTGEISHQSDCVAQTEFSNNNNDLKDTTTSRLATNNIAQGNGKKRKSQAERKSVGTQKSAGGKKKKATPTPTNNSVNPRLCKGLYVCVDYNSERSLGTVRSYNSKNKLFRVGYDDGRVEYLELKDVLENMATQLDIAAAQEKLKASMNAEKTTSGEKKRAARGDGSTSTRKRRNAPTKEKKAPSNQQGRKRPYVALRMRAING